MNAGEDNCSSSHSFAECSVLHPLTLGLRAPDILELGRDGMVFLLLLSTITDQLFLKQLEDYQGNPSCEYPFPEPAESSWKASHVNLSGEKEVPCSRVYKGTQEEQGIFSKCFEFAFYLYHLSYIQIYSKCRRMTVYSQLVASYKASQGHLLA